VEEEGNKTAESMKKLEQKGEKIYDLQNKMTSKVDKKIRQDTGEDRIHERLREPDLKRAETKELLGISRQ
jgi:hypothetical protein